MATLVKTSLWLTTLLIASTSGTAWGQSSSPKTPQVIPCLYQKDRVGSPLDFSSYGGKTFDCHVDRFNRPKNKINGVDLAPHLDVRNVPLLTQIWAIDSPASKVIYTGTVLTVRVESYEVCAARDWRITLLSEETSNVIIYGPADINEMCTKEDYPSLLLVVPVQVIWAEISYYPGNGKDPTRKPAAPVSAPTFYCGNAVQPFPPPVPPGRTERLPLPPPPGGIIPCDGKDHPRLYTNPFARSYNAITQPGASQGTISVTPSISPLNAKATTLAYTYDVQLYASWKLGPGWIGTPVVLEKSTAKGADLGSFTPAISYDLPFSRWRPHVRDPGRTLSVDKNQCGNLISRLRENPEPGTSEIIMLNPNCRPRASVRPPELRVQYGPELSLGYPGDVNMVGAATLRMPILLDFHHQPSAVSVFPVVGVEAGTHVLTHADPNKDIEPDASFRQLTGFDSSTRIPYYFTHSFLGDKPITVDFAWRTRFLSYREPFIDYVTGNPETLTSHERSYWRGSLIVPLATFVSFKLTVQRGGLPPDFKYVGYTVNLGVTFANPGYSEH
jgi:hypothetical protein